MPYCNRLNMLEKKSERKLLRPSWYAPYFHFFDTENALPLSKNVTGKGSMKMVDIDDMVCGRKVWCS